MASDFGVWAMREAGRNEYTVGRNEYEKRGACIVTRYLSRRGTPRRYKDAGQPAPRRGNGGVYAHTEATGGGIFALRRPRPYSRHCEDSSRRIV